MLPGQIITYHGTVQMSDRTSTADLVDPFHVHYAYAAYNMSSNCCHWILHFAYKVIALSQVFMGVECRLGHDDCNEIKPSPFPTVDHSN